MLQAELSNLYQIFIQKLSTSQQDEEWTHQQDSVPLSLQGANDSIEQVLEFVNRESNIKSQFCFTDRTIIHNSIALISHWILEEITRTKLCYLFVFPFVLALL